VKLQRLYAQVCNRGAAPLGAGLPHHPLDVAHRAQHPQPLAAVVAVAQVEHQSKAQAQGQAAQDQGRQCDAKPCPSAPAARRRSLSDRAVIFNL